MSNSQSGSAEWPNGHKHLGILWVPFNILRDLCSLPCLVLEETGLGELSKPLTQDHIASMEWSRHSDLKPMYLTMADTAADALTQRGPIKYSPLK